MPYNRPGPGVYVTNGGSAIQHGQPVIQNNFVGVAVKQQTRSWMDGYSIQKQIDANEPYFLITKGVVQVPDTGVTSPTKGDAVYITSANALTKTSTSNTKFGRIVSVESERGTPATSLRIDLDAKDSF